MTPEKTKSTLQSNRLLSLDVFRGAVIAAMILVNNPGDWQQVFAQLLHAEWHGWTFTDLVFPFFLFIVGAAMVFSLSKRVAPVYKKIIRRFVVLFLLGLFLNAFPYFDFANLRIPGVLQRIAVCYLMAAIIFLHSSKRGQCLWAAGLLFLYWALMEWYPVPGTGAGLYEKGANFAAYIDNLLLKGHMWAYSRTWDPEGIISTLPAITTTLSGILAGHLLKSEKTPVKKAGILFLSGIAAAAAGLTWNIALPINKSLWTASYAVFTAGLASICLSIIYYLIDVRGVRRGIGPFRVFGMNAIAVYVLSVIVAKLSGLIRFTGAEGNMVTLKTRIYDTFFASWPGGKFSSLVYALFFILIMYLFNWILYKKKIFIKI